MAQLKLAAVKIADRLKYSTSLNEIRRIAFSVFPFSVESFPVEGITSERAKLIFDWMMTLFKQRIPDEKKMEYLRNFLDGITPPSERGDVYQILIECGFPIEQPAEDKDYTARRFHPEVIRHSQKLFMKGEYFHAVFEAAKAFNNAVKQKAGIAKDGQDLMHTVFTPERAILRLTPCRTPTERDIQDGFRFLCVGLMAAIRNPTAHEPAITFPIDREDALDVLSFISYLFKQLDKAEYYKEGGRF